MSDYNENDAEIVYQTPRKAPSFMAGMDSGEKSMIESYHYGIRKES